MVVHSLEANHTEATPGLFDSLDSASVMLLIVEQEDEKIEPPHFEYSSCSLRRLLTLESDPLDL